MSADAFASLEWAIVPGPTVLPAPVYPSDGRYGNIVEVCPERAANVFAAIAAVTVAQREDRDWWSWRATYRGPRGLIELEMTLYETEPPLWGGCVLSGVTDARELLALWREVLIRLPSTYLHSSEARLYSVAGFCEAFVR